MSSVQADTLSPEDVVNSISVLLQTIPEANKQFLCYLCKFLNKIALEWKVSSISFSTSGLFPDTK